MNKLIKIYGLTLLAIFGLTACNDDDGAAQAELTAKFTYTTEAENPGRITFINTSENADSYSWDFGDGTTSTVANPVKTFTESGEYVVTLTVTNEDTDESKTFSDTIVINIPLQITLPFNFDMENVIYEPTVFNGASFEIVDNPDPSGSNAAASKVGAITNSGSAFEGLFFDLGEPVDLSMDMTIRMDVWSDVALPVLLKLEEGTGPATEIAVNHTGTGWEELIFTFNSTDSFSRFTLFIDGPGTSSGTFYIDNARQSSTVDTTPPVITLIGEASIDLTLGETFMDPGATATDNLDGDISANIVVGGDTVDTNNLGTYTITYNVMDAAGNAADEVTRTVEVVAAPTTPQISAPTPSEPQNNVISVYSDAYNDISVDGYNLYGGADFEEFNVAAGDTALRYTTAGNAFQVIEFGGANQQDLLAAGITHFHIDLWFPTIDASDSFLIKVVDILGGAAAEALLTIDGSSNPALTSGQWLSYDFTLQDLIDAGLSRQENVQQIVFDLIDTDEVFIDNVYFYGNGGGGGGGTGCSGTPVEATSLPLDFEDCQLFTSTFSSIGESGVTTSLAANPNPSGINTSENVMQVVRASGISRWGGLQNSFPQGVIDITTNTFKIKVYSSVPDVTYRFELALDPQTEPVTGNPAPVFRQVTGGANEWVELEFTFTNLPATPTTYNQLVIKPDNPEGSDGETTSEERTFYFDDLRLD